MFVTGPPDAISSGLPVWSVVRGINGVQTAHHNYSKVCWLLTTVQTTLKEDIDGQQQVIQVVGRRNFPVSGRFYILIDDEQMLVTDQKRLTESAGDFPTTDMAWDLADWAWSVQRGANGTTVTSHTKASAVVFQKFPDKVEGAQAIVFDDSAFVQPGVPGPESDIKVAVHHEVVQTVRITNSTPNASGLYDAFLQKWDANRMRMVDDIYIWVKDINT